MIVYIDHVPNSMAYRTALSPRELQERATIHVETRDAAKLAPLLHAVGSIHAMPDARPADLRYAIHLRDERGAARMTIYLDAFGTRGWIDGKAVRLDSDAIKRAMVEISPALAR